MRSSIAAFTLILVTGCPSEPTAPPAPTPVVTPTPTPATSTVTAGARAFPLVVSFISPGNGTDGGAARWARILENEFDLIVKGVVRYSLPFSNRIKSAAVSGRATVKPHAANDPSLRPNATVGGMVKRTR